MIYADYNASTPLCSKVANFLIERIKNKSPFANPNSSHTLGRQVAQNIESSRSTCAKILGCQNNQIILNSGASEGIANIFHSALTNFKKTKNKILISEMEHSAIKKTASYYLERGYSIEKIRVNQHGKICTDHLESLLSNKDVKLVCAMAANNETGILQPYKNIAQICKKYDALCYCDTTQLIAKDEFNLQDSRVDYATVSGHKFGALIGAGLLLVKNPEKLIPLIPGAAQEKGLRGGTQNYLGFETMAIALKEYSKERSQFLGTKRDQFEQQLIGHFADKLFIIGDQQYRLPGTSLISFPGMSGQGMQIELEREEILVTTSSACSDGSNSVSPPLKAMGIDETIGRGTIRIGLSYENMEEYPKVLEGIINAYSRLSLLKVNSP